MKGLIYIIIILVGGHFLLPENTLPNNLPKQLTIAVDWNQIAQSQLVTTFSNPDTLLSHDLHLLTDKKDLPLLYYADIQTPVCIDGLCKPVYIEMYWDLTGQYVGYGEYPEQQLNKYDHEIFNQQDYIKLHQLLLDRHSVLERRKLATLYDATQVRKEKIKFKGVEVDGVSGATKKEIKSSVVEGALYSCYTLWHIANGSAAIEIKQQLPLIYNDSLEQYFLNSDWEIYQEYAIKQLSTDKFEENIKPIVHILKNTKPLTRAYILKKMPKKLFGHPLMEQEVYSSFSNLDFNSKTLLIKGLPYANASVVKMLSEQLSALSKNQIITFLELVQKHPALQSTFLFNQLDKISQDENFTYSFLVKEFLEKE